MIPQPTSFTVNLPNPLSPEQIAARRNTHYSDKHTKSLGYKRATVGGFVWVMAGDEVRADLDYDGSNIQALWEGTQRFYNVPTLSDRLIMHSRISDTFVRKGSRYFQIESVVVANDTKPIVSEKLTRLIHLGSPLKAT